MRGIYELWVPGIKHQINGQELDEFPDHIHPALFKFF